MSETVSDIMHSSVLALIQFLANGHRLSYLYARLIAISRANSSKTIENALPIKDYIELVVKT